MFSFLLWSYLFVDANAAQIGEYARVFSLPAVNDSLAMDQFGTTQVGSSLFVGLNPTKKTSALVIYFFDLSSGKSFVEGLVALQEDYKERGVHLVLICTEPGPLGPISSWVDSEIIDIPVLRDKYHIVKSNYEVSSGAEAFVIDPLGRVFSKASLRSNSDLRDLRKRTEELVHQVEMGAVTPD